MKNLCKTISHQKTAAPGVKVACGPGMAGWSPPRTRNRFLAHGWSSRKKRMVAGALSVARRDFEDQ